MALHVAEIDAKPYEGTRGRYEREQTPTEEYTALRIQEYEDDRTFEICYPTLLNNTVQHHCQMGT